MNSVLKWVGAPIMLALTFAAPVKAQTTEPLTDTTEFFIPSSGGWGITLTGCEVNSAACTSSVDASVTASVIGSTLSLVFSGTNGPTGSADNLLYNNGSGIDQDLTINVVITAPTGKLLTSGTDLLSQSSTTTGSDSNVTVSDTLTGQVAMISALGTSQALQTYFAPVASITAGIDIRAGRSGNTGITTSIPSATVTFNVPEPVSSSLFAVGIAGLGLVRQRPRRT